MSAEQIGKASIAMMNRSDHTALVKQIKDRLMIIQGLYDQVVSTEVMRKKEAELGFHLCEVESSHMSLFETPMETSECLKTFLKENGN